MSLLKSEPFAAVESMDELLAVAYAMEQEAITGYSELAERMRREGRPDMVPVFERLIDEESQHLAGLSDFIGKPISLQSESAMGQEQYDIVLL